MRALAAVKTSSTIVRLLPKPAIKRWTQLSEPVFPSETDARMRAQSLLTGLSFQDNTRTPGGLTFAQAQDVLRWATTRIL
jgi:hypothetical protein